MAEESVGGGVKEEEWGVSLNANWHWWWLVEPFRSLIMELIAYIVCAELLGSSCASAAGKKGHVW